MGRLTYRKHFKRGLDIAFVIAVAPIAVPLIAAMAFLVALDGGRPFYRQMRVGRHGKTFGMVKMRSMVRDAHGRLAQHLAEDPAARAEWERTQKLKNDPRITRIGGILRRTSMDELPQLWNVLTGEMSVVGPRPMMEDQKDLYPGTEYYALRPGITGAWQVSDRNNTAFAARAHYDADYYRSLSLKTDTAILLKTFRAVLNCTGY
ncbi:sugar transferase [Maritimibacter dapengensis]|uniref:sugar transferase n=1 Tax=Maritimibacter dapengensis TaxID=2836868 RepID=UPI00300D363F